MRFHQRGATFIGMLIIFAIVGFGLYLAMRLVPVYYEYMAVTRALDQISKQFSGEPTSVQELRTALARRWDVDNITSLSFNDVEIKKEGSGYAMRAWYRAQTSFIGNVSLVADFDKSVVVTQ